MCNISLLCFEQQVQKLLVNKQIQNTNNHFLYKMKVKVLFPVMSDSLWPLDCSPPGSSVHGILQARIPKWVAIPFSRGSFHPRDQTRSPTMQADSLLSDLPGKLTTISRRACYKYPFLGSIFKNCILIGPLFLSMQWHRSHSEMMFKHRFL